MTLLQQMKERREGERDLPEALTYPRARAYALASRNTAKCPPKSWQKSRAASQVIPMSLARYKHVSPKFMKLPGQDTPAHDKTFMRHPSKSRLTYVFITRFVHAM